MDSKCSIYMKIGGRKIKIPVNPPDIEMTYPTAHKKFDVIGKGEIVVPGKPSLKAVSWESFFPKHDAAYVNDGAKAPGYYVGLLEKAWKNKQRIRLIITRSGLYDTNMACVIANFKANDRGGEPDDVYYSIELIEYRNYAPEVVAVITQPTDANQQAEITVDSHREIETPVLRVGASVIANGRYWYDSYGSKPYGTANNLSTTVTRIVEGNPYPIHIGSYGWLQESQLQIVG